MKQTKENVIREIDSRIEKGHLFRSILSERPHQQKKDEVEEKWFCLIDLGYSRDERVPLHYNRSKLNDFGIGEAPCARRRQQTFWA